MMQILIQHFQFVVTVQSASIDFKLFIAYFANEATFVGTFLVIPLIIEFFPNMDAVFTTSHIVRLMWAPVTKRHGMTCIVHSPFKFRARTDTMAGCPKAHAHVVV